jgi:succinate dehydrogenase (ubiquinone) membrane anchor subunit
MAKQNNLCVTPSVSQSGVIVQNVKPFSLSAKQMAGHGHDHSKLWTAEKVLSASLLGIIPAAFVIPSQFMDYLLAISIVMHNHW